MVKGNLDGYNYGPKGSLEEGQWEERMKVYLIGILPLSSWGMSKNVVIEAVDNEEGLTLPDHFLLPLT